MNNGTKIGLGTAAIGRPQYINIRQQDVKIPSLEAFRQQGKQLLDHAYELGIRYYDTAPGYGFAEQLLIDWSTGKKDIEIATKWGYTYTANFKPDAKVHEIKDHSLSKLNEQWTQSKALLPNLSTYQIHSATFETGVLNNIPVLEKLAQLKREHQILMGLTTTGANQTEVLKKALEVTVNGDLLFDVFQVTYNVFDQSLATIDPILLEGKRLIIKEALANGRVFRNPNYPHYNQVYQLLEKLATSYEVGLDAIALRFAMDSIPAFKVLSGAATTEHLSDNLKAEDISLSEGEIEEIRNLAVVPDAYWEERKKLIWN